MKRTILLTVAVLLAASVPVPAATRPVPSEYPTIQDAIDDCNDGDVVIVAPGTYTGPGNRDIDFLGKAITVRSIDPDDPNIVAATIIDCNGTEADPHRGVYFHSGEDANSILAGLTITNGYASGSGPDGRGSAIYCLQSSPTITSCVISGNSSKYHTGAICCYDSNSTIANCIVTNNTGAGISCIQDQPTVTNCVISHNSDGPGILALCGGFVISNCIITGNGGESGGGILCWARGRCRSIVAVTITNCAITQNTAYEGAGIYVSDISDVDITNCTITQNTASYRGAGIYLGSIRDAVINNCTIAQNTAGEGIYLYNSDAVLTNCTIAGNSYNGIFSQYGNETITNCILWGNYAKQIKADNGTPSVTYSNIQDGWPGEGNIHQEPHFALSTDYHLMPDSPCIDAGTNTPVGGLPAPDIEGNPRTLDGNGDGNAVTDMGAYEYNPSGSSIAVSAVSFSFGGGWPKPPPQTLLIRNSGIGTLNWRIVGDCPWLQVSSTNGTSTNRSNEVTLTADPNGVPTGCYTSILTVLDPNAANSPVKIHVVLHVGALLRVPQHFSTIQAGIDAAADYDVVLVADGNYTGEGNTNLDFDGKAIAVCSRNGPNNCIIDCQNSGRAFYFHTGEKATSLVQGLTITGGNARYDGGAISCEHSSPTISGCKITRNSAYTGGGIFCRSSNPIITNCAIIQNTTDNDGAGIFCEEGDPTITHCTIMHNNAHHGSGGGICCYVNSATIINCTIIHNTARHSGGGIRYIGNSQTITNCIIAQNTATLGGGIRCASGRTTITNCTITGNKASGWGGGGIFSSLLYPTDLVITNCTISGNWAMEKAGAIFFSYGNLTITSSILSDNWPQQIEVYRWADCAVMYSNVENGWEGQGNIDADPCFVEPGHWDPNGTPDEPWDDFWVEGDYHLLPPSCCINAGDPNYIAEPDEIDLDSKPRVIAGRIDMGAYEFNHIPVADAGPNQIAYAWIDGIARVTLDASASYDDDGQPLTYLWTWIIDSNIYEANGVSPTIELPVGEYTIELIVSDGIDDSEPDYVDVNVVAPLQADLRMLPRIINRYSRMRRVMALLRLPEGISKDQIDRNEPLMLYPAGSEEGITAMRQFILRPRRYGTEHTSILAFFNKAELMDSVPNNGRVELHVVGRLTTGQYFYGSDMASIKCWRRQPPPRRRKW